MSVTWYAGGQYGQIRRSTDGGVTWSVFTSPTALDVYAMHGLTDTSFWIGTRGDQSTTPGQIWYYNGTSWTLQYTDTGVNRYVVNMFMASASEGYAITTDWYADQFRILKWNGTTWSIVDSPWSSPVRTIHADGNGNVIAGAAGHQSNYQVRYSLNSGSTWSWGVDDHNRPNAGCWIDDDGNWYYLTGQFTTGANLGLFKSSDPSVAFTQILTISNPKTVNQVVRTENSLWFDGSKFYILGSTTGGQKQILVFDPVALTENWFDATTTLTSIHGTSSVDIKVACDSNSNPNNVVDFNGATAVDRDVQAGGTSARYYSVFGYLNDTTPPFLSGQDPAPGDTKVSVNKNITLTVEDTESSLDQSSVIIQIERGSGWETVWTGDAQQSGFVVTKTVIAPNKVQYTIDPDIIFPNGQLVQVRVQADDTFSPANSLDTTYSFTTKALTKTWFVVGSNNQIRKSTDNGATWSVFTGPYAGAGMWCIDGLDEDNIWVGDNAGKISYWNGSTWTTQLTVPGYRISTIYIGSPTFGIAIAYSGSTSYPTYIWDGATWSLSIGTVAPWGNGCWASSDGVSAVGCGSGNGGSVQQLKITQNGGSSWNNYADKGTTTGGFFYADGYYYFCDGYQGKNVYRSTTLTGPYSLYNTTNCSYSNGINGTSGMLYAANGHTFVVCDDTPSYYYLLNHYNGSVNTRYGPTSQPITGIFGIDENNVIVSCGTNLIAKFNGSSLTEQNIQAGGASADYYDVYAIGINDTAGPYLSDQSPADSSIGISASSNISFDIIDEYSPINQSSLIISLDQGSGYETVWTGDAQQSGYVVTKTVIQPNQINFLINPDNDLTKNEIVTIRVQGEDSIGNPIDETFSFEVELSQVWYVVGGRGGSSPYGKIYRSLDKINWPEMSQLPAGGAYPINCIHGTDPNNIWVGLASNGSNSFSSIWYFNGKSWAQQYQFVLDYTFVTSIYMLSETLGYAAAYRGVTTKTVYVLKWDGNNWSIISSYGTGGDYISTIHARGNIIMHGIVNSSPGQPIIRYSLNGGSGWAYGADVVSSGGNPIAGGATSGVWVGDDGKYYWMRKYSGLYRSTDLSANFTQIVPDSLATGWIPGSGKGNSIWGAGGDDIYFGYGILSEGAVAVGHWNGSTVVTVDTNQRAIQSLYGASRREIGTAYNTGLGNGRAVITNGVTYTVDATSPGLTGDMYGVLGFGEFDPPYLDNVTPSNGETEVVIDVDVSLSIIDLGVGLDVDSVILKIDSVIVWQNRAQQNGYLVTETPVTDGYRYIIDPPSNFGSYATVLVEVYAEDLNSNVLDTSYSFTTENLISITEIESIFIVAKDIIKINFTDNVSTKKGYLSTDSYSVTSLSSSNQVYVEKVLVPVNNYENFVYIKVKGIVPGERYQVSISNASVYDLIGDYLNNQSITFLGRTTKLDSTLSSLANFYDTRNRSNIRGILEAINISDEEIGGDY